MINASSWGTGVAGVAALVVTMVTLAACSATSGVHAQGPVAPTSSETEDATNASSSAAPTFPLGHPSGGTSADSAPILAQYRAFFDLITPAWMMPDAAARAAAMADLAVDPEYTMLLSAMKATRDAGEVGYGDDVVRPEVQSVVGDQATLVDCQNTSSHGRMTIATGVKVTQGRKNDLAQVTMKRGPDGIWRVATVAYAAAGSCHADG